MASISDAVKSNNPRILKLMTTVPGSFTINDVNQALIQASKLGFQECVTCLLDAGGDPNFVTNGNSTPLLAATQARQLNVVGTLLAAGSEVNFRSNGRQTALHMTARNGITDIVLALVTHGANINAQDSSGNTPLILASQNAQYLVMQALLANGCDINRVNNNGCSALHYACYKARGFQILLNAGANPDICDKDNCTPLIMAATEGFDGVVKALVAAKCDVNIVNNSVQKSALHILAFKGHSDCIDDLIYGGASIDLCDVYQHTPLWYAIKNQKSDVIKLLLRANSCVDTYQCSPGIPQEACPTRMAVSQGMLHVIKMFIVTGYDQCHLRECLQSEEFSPCLRQSEDFSHWVNHAVGAQSLKQICRKWIRHHLGRQLYHHLRFLPLPEVMKDYIFLKELDDH